MASSSPTSTLTPREKFPDELVPVTLCRKPPTAAEVPPPICTFSTSWAATPAIWETTVSLIVVLPRSLWRGLCCSLTISPLLEGYAHIHAQNVVLLNPGAPTRREERSTVGGASHGSGARPRTSGQRRAPTRTGSSRAPGTGRTP